MAWHKPLLHLGVIAIVALLVLEGLARGYYVGRRNQAWLVSPSDLVYMYYPELEAVLEGSLPENAEILILGGSVLASEFSHVDRLLHERISWPKDGGREIWNLAAPAII